MAAHPSKLEKKGDPFQEVSEEKLIFKINLLSEEPRWYVKQRQQHFLKLLIMFRRIFDHVFFSYTTNISNYCITTQNTFLHTTQSAMLNMQIGIGNASFAALFGK